MTTPTVQQGGEAEADDEGPCTDCEDTGVTTQTERRCACQPPEQQQAESAQAKLARLIKERLVGVHHDDQDLYLEDDDWRLILSTLATPQPTETGSGWIVSNGSDTAWRTWRDGFSAWTEKREEATRYARREDAEAVHYHDEDAWHVKPYDAQPTDAQEVIVTFEQAWAEKEADGFGWEIAVQALSAMPLPQERPDLIALIERFDQAAQGWGWEADQGIGGEDTAECLEEYRSAKAALIAALPIETPLIPASKGQNDE